MDELLLKVRACVRACEERPDPACPLRLRREPRPRAGQVEDGNVDAERLYLRLGYEQVYVDELAEKPAPSTTRVKWVRTTNICLRKELGELEDEEEDEEVEREDEEEDDEAGGGGFWRQRKFFSA